MTDTVTLSAFLTQQLFISSPSADIELIRLLEAVARSCVRISAGLRQGALAGILGSLETENVQGETQKKLDVIANQIMLDELDQSGTVAGMASEEMEDPVLASGRSGPYLIFFDPLDGSSNIDVNVSVGTIFSIVRAPQAAELAETRSWLQPGRMQVAAGYAIYGPSTQLVLTLGHGVQAFTLDVLTGCFVLTAPRLQIPPTTSEFAINVSNQRFWDESVHSYIQDLLQGSSGPRGKHYNMRWVASMVADVHRISTRGGVFLYPVDARIKEQGGKLRLMYEANPMSWLVEQAGGRASTGQSAILDVVPQGLHQRVPVILGSCEEVENLIQRYCSDGF